MNTFARILFETGFSGQQKPTAIKIKGVSLIWLPEQEMTDTIKIIKQYGKLQVENAQAPGRRAEVWKIPTRVYKLIIIANAGILPNLHKLFQMFEAGADVKEIDAILNVEMARLKHAMRIIRTLNFGNQVSLKEGGLTITFKKVAEPAQDTLTTNSQKDSVKKIVTTVSNSVGFKIKYIDWINGYSGMFYFLTDPIGVISTTVTDAVSLSINDVLYMSHGGTDVRWVEFIIRTANTLQVDPAGQHVLTSDIKAGIISALLNCVPITAAIAFND